MQTQAPKARFMWSTAVDGGQKKASGALQIGSFDIDSMIIYAQKAEALGMEQLLLGFGFHIPDPLTIVGILLRHTKTIKFMVAYRAGFMSPTLFAQCINTLSSIDQDRVTLNLLAGISPTEQKYYGDHLGHDKRYARLDEYIHICHKLWYEDEPFDFDGTYYQVEQAQLKVNYIGQSKGPELFLSGNSDVARNTAIKHNATWLRYSNTVESVAENILPAINAGINVGIRMSVIVRPTRQEALDRIDYMMSGADHEWAKVIKDYVATCDSTAVKSVFDLAEKAKNDWLNETLWTGAIPYRGGPSLAMVGDPDQVAEYIMRYKRAGVTTFLLHGWPILEELEYFAQLVIPRVREMEAAELTKIPASVAS